MLFSPPVKKTDTPQQLLRPFSTKKEKTFLMRKPKLLAAAIMLCSMASFAALPINASAHSSLPRLYFNRSTSPTTFATANTPVTVVSVPNVKAGSYEVSFDGSIQFPDLSGTSGSQPSDTVTCSITVLGSTAETTVRENTGNEQATNDTIPFAVTSVVQLPRKGTVSGVCQDSATGATILAGAQITLVQGKIASHFPALKTPLTTANIGCNFEPAGGTGTGTGTGFAIINKTGSGQLIANVVLKNAAPNATYNVRLIQTPNAGLPGPSECTMVDGTLHTNVHGNGTANIHEPVLIGSNDAFVVLNNQAAPGTDFYRTQGELFF